MPLILTSAAFGRRRARAGASMLVLLCALAGVAQATPPSLPPPHFHPFGPPTQLIPDGSVVPLRPVKPLQTMTPMFMLPLNPFGHLGQNFGALGGTLNIEQRQVAPHRKPVELVPPRPGKGATQARGATGATGATSSATSPARGAATPAHRRPLGW